MEPQAYLKPCFLFLLCLSILLKSYWNRGEFSLKFLAK
ncbi:hypothetical protein ADU37_CDS06630 [Thermococcus sp. 2319x1]|nr:hypothetical protein ADU37_CDS06630 [Thermococcus sp. 2319x1]